MTKWYMEPEVIARILASIDFHEEGHWLWKGEFNRNGYGRISTSKGGRRRRVMAHRAVYEICRGPIPPRRVLDHGCRIRNCVLPSHTEPVTNRTNTLRGLGPTALNARKEACLRGHPFDARRRNGWRVCTTCIRIRDLRRTNAQKSG